MLNRLSGTVKLALLHFNIHSMCIITDLYILNFAYAYVHAYKIINTETLKIWLIWYSL